MYYYLLFCKSDVHIQSMYLDVDLNLTSCLFPHGWIIAYMSYGLQTKNDMDWVTYVPLIVYLVKLLHSKHNMEVHLHILSTSTSMSLASSPCKQWLCNHIQLVKAKNEGKKRVVPVAVLRSRYVYVPVMERGGWAGRDQCKVLLHHPWMLEVSAWGNVCAEGCYTHE